MNKAKAPWTEDEIALLKPILIRSEPGDIGQIAHKLGRSYKGVENRLRLMRIEAGFIKRQPGKRFSNHPTIWTAAEDAHFRLEPRMTIAELRAVGERLNRSLGACETRYGKLRKAAGIATKTQRAAASITRRPSPGANASGGKIYVSRHCLSCQAWFSYDRSDGVPLFMCSHCRTSPGGNWMGDGGVGGRVRLVR